MLLLLAIDIIKIFVVVVVAVVVVVVVIVLQWGSKAFQNMTIVPPGSGIVHQVKNNVSD